MFGKDFIDNLNKTRSQRIYKNALLKILDNYFNKDRNKLRTFLYKWKDQIRKLQISDLIVKLIKNLGNKNDVNNRKLRLSKAIHKWLLNCNIDKLNERESSEKLKKGKMDKKNFAALIMKILKRVFNKNDKDTILRNTIKKWLEIVKKIKEKENANIKEGTKHIIIYNSIKNSEDLLNKLRDILILSLKNKA